MLHLRPLDVPSQPAHMLGLGAVQAPAIGSLQVSRRERKSKRDDPDAARTCQEPPKDRSCSTVPALVHVLILIRPVIYLLGSPSSNSVTLLPPFFARRLLQRFSSGPDLSFFLLYSVRDRSNRTVSFVAVLHHR